MKNIVQNMKSTSFIHETKHIYIISGAKVLMRYFIDKSFRVHFRMEEMDLRKRIQWKKRKMEFTD
jgi:hypothetical protein